MDAGKSSDVRWKPAVRLGLVLLAVIDGVVGGWALLAPTSFYQNFPGLGMHWVAAEPPYNQHLVTDFGGALLGIAAALAVAAVVAERRIIQVVLLAALVQAVSHLTFHLTHSDALPAGQLVLTRMALAVPVVLALSLLWLLRTGSRQKR